MLLSGRGRVGRAGGYPTISAGSISAAGVQIVGISSAPDDHFTAGPDCGGKKSARGRVAQAGGCPTIRAGIVSSAGVYNDDRYQIRPRRSFHCRHTAVCKVRASAALVVLVGVQLSVLGLYLAPVFKLSPLLSVPPQMIISVPVHTAV